MAWVFGQCDNTDVPFLQTNMVYYKYSFKRCSQAFKQVLWMSNSFPLGSFRIAKMA